MASTEPRSKTTTSSFDINGGKKEPNEYEEKSYIYESLEEIHIFALAHVLRRPIIIIADTMLKDSKGEAFFPIPFGGLYLPFECPNTCLMKSPLCLTYDSAHFSALVAMNHETGEDSSLPLAIPLMDVDHSILPLHFAIDPGESAFSSSTESPDKLFDSLAKTFVLTEQDKIELLKMFFDIITLDHLKAFNEETPKSSVFAEKSQTLPNNFGRNPVEFNDISSAEANKTLARKSSAKYLLQKPFSSFGRMSKRIKKNIGNIARRSTSFKLIKSKGSNNNTQPVETASTSINQTESSLGGELKESIINTDNSVFYCETYVYAARIQIDKRPFYYNDMIKNYITTARLRYLNEKRTMKLKSIPSVSSLSSSSTSSLSSAPSPASSVHSIKEAASSLPSSNILDGINCVSPNCFQSSTATTNYLCTKHFDEQKRTLIQSDYGKNVSATEIKAEFPSLTPTTTQMCSVPSPVDNLESYKPMDKGLSVDEVDLDAIKQFNKQHLANGHLIPNSQTSTR